MSTDEIEPTFEAALDGLERIVDELERGDLDLSASLAGYEKGVALLARCQALLDGVDRSVALLTGVEADGTPVVVPFDASATAVETPSPKTPRPRARKAAVPEPEPEPKPEINGEIDPPF
jgi:exodeoxyribonuclease VII small subunit